MRKYRPSLEKFHTEIPLYRGCESPISDLMKRFKIRGQNVLSVGGGSSEEEYWFTQGDSRLSIIDIDEQGLIEPVLKSSDVSEKDSSEPTFD